MYSRECRGTLDEDGGKLRTTSAAREMSEATMAQGAAGESLDKGHVWIWGCSLRHKEQWLRLLFPDFLQSGDGGECLLGEFGAADRANI